MYIGGIGICPIGGFNGEAGTLTSHVSPNIAFLLRIDGTVRMSANAPIHSFFIFDPRCSVIDSLW